MALTVSIVFWKNVTRILISPESFQNVWKQRADPVQSRNDNDHRGNPDVSQVLEERVLVGAHGFLVVQEKNEKYQGRRKQGNRYHLHEQSNEHQRRARSQDYSRSQQEIEEIVGVEPRRLPELLVQRVSP